MSARTAFGIRRRPRLLERFLATWTDGVERVIHAHDLDAASDLAGRLSTVKVQSVVLLASEFRPVAGLTRKRGVAA
jgi:hypothetical protein